MDEVNLIPNVDNSSLPEIPYLRGVLTKSPAIKAQAPQFVTVVGIQEVQKWLQMFSAQYSVAVSEHRRI